MNIEVFSGLVKCLVELVSVYKSCLSVMAPEGWQKEYLRTMCKSIVNLQRAILQLDTYKPFLRYLSADLYKLSCRALSYDSFLFFRKSIVEHDNLVNDTFLFVE